MNPVLKRGRTMTTYTYELLKWTRDGKEALVAYGTRFPVLKPALDKLMSVERTFAGDIEALKDAARGVNSNLLNGLAAGVFAFVYLVQGIRAEMLDGDESVLRDIRGLEFKVFSTIRLDLLGLKSTVRRKGATLSFDRYGKGWVITLEAGCASPVFKLACPAVPETVEALNLREQLDWLKADEEEANRQIDAIIENPANWPTDEQRREAEIARLDEMAAKVVGMMASEDRELAHRDFDEFSKRVSALLIKATAKR
jgi:hypothetical protein